MTGPPDHSFNPPAQPPFNGSSGNEPSSKPLDDKPSGDKPIVPPKPPQPMLARACNCPGCGSRVAVKAWGQSLSVVCQSCNRILDLSNASVRILSEANKQLKHPPTLPLGHRGRLNGIQWEIIGYMRREDVDSRFQWSEYLLFNPYRGYRWLTEANGHWSLVDMKKTQPTGDFKSAENRQITFELQTYRLYHRGQARVVQVLGEFYWQVKAGDTVRVEDYICPPYQLSAEKTGDEWVWSVGTYIQPDDLLRAMGLEGKNGNPAVRLLPPQDIAPHQPSPYQPHQARMLGLWGIFVAVIVLVQLGHLASSKSQLVQHAMYQTAATYANKTYSPAIPSVTPPEIVTPSFQIEDGPGNVRVDVVSAVDNNWVSVDGELVNEQTGQRFPFSKTVEYYTGVDSDGRWVEGNQAVSEHLHDIPAGRYHLEFEQNASIKGAPYTVSLYRSVPTWINMLLALLFVSLNPLVFLLRSWNFEVRRWADSLYSPYASE